MASLLLVFALGGSDAHAGPERAPAPGPGVHAAHAALAPSGRFDAIHATHPAALPPPSAPPDHTVYGYLPYWTVAIEDVPWTHLTHLAVFNVSLESDGTLSSTSHWTSVAADAVRLGHAAGVKVHVCVTSFDDSVMSSVLPSAARRAAAVDALATLVDTYGADGVNIDYEGMPASLRADLVTFTVALKQRVDEVYLATPAVDWSDAYDYASLAAASDGLFIMGYGYHWTGGDPGPNAPLDAGDLWSRWTLAWSVDDYVAAGVPRDKIVLGLPTYGQEWPVSSSSAVPGSATDGGWSVTYTEAVADAAAAGRSYDSVSNTAWYARTSTRQAWYDDADSLDIKMDWAVNDAGLAGFGFWAIGYDGDDPALWSAVDAASHDPEDTDPGGDDTGSPDTDPGDTDPGDTDRGDTDPRPGKAQLLGEQAGCACGVTDIGSGWLALAPLLAFARRRSKGSEATP